MNKLEEGSSYIQLLQLMKILGHNIDVDIELATVKAIDPLKIQVDHMEIELEGSDLIVAEHLLEHKRLWKIEKQSLTLEGQVDSHDLTATGNFNGTIAGNPASGPITLPKNQFTFTKLDLTVDATGDELEMTFYPKLVEEDRVIVASINQNQHYIVLDKAVIQ
ncbi:DUF2577 family protein [Chengkuizengella sp. SCS-71B]|uniref:DUF2577 family protein n=1 Tax=Chengkuizengella sp. SCS-71B TaxID=3115290 RepID=UPI0032C21D80